MLKKIILGNNPHTTIVGAVLAGLYALQTTLATPNVQWYNVAITVAIAVLGRVAGDSANTSNK